MNNNLLDKGPSFIEKHFWKIWVIGMLISILILAGIVYVAVHFIGKWW